MKDDQAKKIPLDNLLSKLGFSPAKIAHQGNELWYNSPLRDEKTPSFKVDIQKNLWYDFGGAEGGTTIDFVVRFKTTDVKGALAFLEDNFSTSKSNYVQPKDHLTKNIFGDGKGDESRGVFILKEVKKFPSHANNALSKYIINERGIDAAIATQFLKEIHFDNAHTGKHYFAAGIENTEGGYEVRNPFFKGTVPEKTKSIALLKTVAEGNKKVICFEGMLDFLSYTTLFGVKVGEDYLILNTVSFVEKAIKAIKKGQYEDVKTYFDNDAAGHKATDAFTSELPLTEPQNAIYAQNEDLNAFLMQLKKNEIKK